jgi:hypothetical protein
MKLGLQGTSVIFASGGMYFFFVNSSQILGGVMPSSPSPYSMKGIFGVSNLWASLWRDFPFIERLLTIILIDDGVAGPPLDPAGPHSQVCTVNLRGFFPSQGSHESFTL